MIAYIPVVCASTCHGFSLTTIQYHTLPLMCFCINPSSTDFRRAHHSVKMQKSTRSSRLGAQHKVSGHVESRLSVLMCWRHARLSDHCCVSKPWYFETHPASPRDVVISAANERCRKAQYVVRYARLLRLTGKFLKSRQRDKHRHGAFEPYQ